MHKNTEQPHSSAAGLRIAIVTSRYHDSITSRLRDGAVGLYQDAGGDVADLQLLNAPGAFELIAICRELAMNDTCDAIVAIGCVITGQTTHDQYICHAVSAGLSNITVQTGVPIAFGVLTCQSMEHAADRAGGAKGNKGAEAMSAAIDCVHTLHEIRSANRTGQPVIT